MSVLIAKLRNSLTLRGRRGDRRGGTASRCGQWEHSHRSALERALLSFARPARGLSPPPRGSRRAPAALEKAVLGQVVGRVQDDRILRVAVPPRDRNSANEHPGPLGAVVNAVGRSRVHYGMRDSGWQQQVNRWLSSNFLFADECGTMCGSFATRAKRQVSVAGIDDGNAAGAAASRIERPLRTHHTHAACQGSTPCRRGRQIKRVGSRCAVT